MELLETHISWVILTGPFAYKIKKPIQFDFVDYSTLEKRKWFCEREVELNRRFAPELYLGVVAISELDGKPFVGADGLSSDGESQRPAVDYAVMMRQFPQACILASKVAESSQQAGDRQREAVAVEGLGEDIARFHAAAERANEEGTFATPTSILADANDNLALLESVFTEGKRRHDLTRLKRWTDDRFAELEAVFLRRLQDGWVRLCHGDMHLKNIVELGGRWVPFDGIEFNEDFQWIDLINEIAFPVMDFVARGRADLGWRLLNNYLEATGDYQGLQLLRFYMVYRALVRAKVTWLNPHNHCDQARAKLATDSNEPDLLVGPWDKYLRVASQFALEMQPALSITHGFSGSGKSTVAMSAIAKTGGVRIRADAERMRLAKKFPNEPKYSPSVSERVYGRLLEVARIALKAGLPVIADATFLQRNRRSEFERLAADLRVPYAILACDAPIDELRRRIAARDWSDASDATAEVLEKQIQSHDPLTESEVDYVVRSVN